jgi:oxygen-independent coproporphyrinogen III oxidase
MDQETFARYAAMRVPRYTSYPTAPNFSQSIGAENYLRWLAGLELGSDISLYLHIPFCREMCWYCGCHTSVTRRRGPVERYVEALRSELRLVAAMLPGQMRVRHLHWGGGSPTLLAADEFDALAGDLRACFDIAEDAEHAIEIDPRTLTADFAAALERNGVNRASLGVQSFDAQVQRTINRVQSVEQTAAALGVLRASGIRAVNFDLVYGLPHQTVASCLRTVQQSLAMRPDRLAVFGYAHVPGFKPHQRRIDSSALPGPEERQRQAQAIADALQFAGYTRIGLDHFALPDDSLVQALEAGSLHRNFQGYTADPSPVLIGLGASAIGKLPQGFVQNATNIAEYQRRIAGRNLPITRGCRISSDDSRRAAIIERLMCDYRADAGRVAAPALTELERDGLIRRAGSVVEVREEARPLVRAVAAAFDAYLPQTASCHVAAV